jgi:hypothetical protein
MGDPEALFFWGERDIKGQTVKVITDAISGFTANGGVVLTDSNFGTTQQVETVMTGQTLAHGAAVTALLFGALSTPSVNGITSLTNSISLTKKGLYGFKVQAQANISCAIKTIIKMDGVNDDSANFQALVVAGGNISHHAMFWHEKTTTGTTAVTFDIQGDSSPTIGTDVILANTGEIKIMFWPTVAQ